MSLELSIRVANDRGWPISGRRVTLFFSLLDGYKTRHTNSDGWAEFEFEHLDDDDVVYIPTIQVGSEDVDSEVKLRDGETRSYTVSE